MISAIIQARLGSTRLPGKVLLDVCGQTVMERVVNAVRGSTLVPNYVLTSPDMELCRECERRNIHWIHWGGVRDPLGEFYNAASIFRYDHIVRITCDCPLLEPKTIDDVVRSYLGSGKQLGYNRCDETGGPGDGQDVEVFSFDALEDAYLNATEPYDREHVTPYIRRNYEAVIIPPPEGECASLDTEEDYKKICEILRRRENVR